jgi:hypothetical protein
MADYKSERTKKLEKSKVDDDMPGIKKVVRGVSLTASRAMDKVEGAFKGKGKEPKKKMAVGGSVTKAFKPCKGCPSPAKCKAAGKCMAKKAATGMLVLPVKMEKKSAAKKRK